MAYDFIVIILEEQSEIWTGHFVHRSYWSFSAVCPLVTVCLCFNRGCGNRSNIVTSKTITFRHIVFVVKCKWHARNITPAYSNVVDILHPFSLQPQCATSVTALPPRQPHTCKSTYNNTHCSPTRRAKNNINR